MLRPFLLVGIGGSGGKTLRALRVILERRLAEIPEWKDGWPEGWQMLHIDTPTAQDGPEFPAPFLPGELYHGMVPPSVQYQALISAMVGQPHTNIKLSSEDMDRYAGWIPNPAAVTVPVSDGAGQYRAIGKSLTIAQLSRISDAVTNSLSKLGQNTAVSQLARLASILGSDATGQVDPSVLVISSIAGGSGAGAFMDVIEAIKAADSKPWLQRTIAWLYTPEVFEFINGNSGTAPNALGAISEAMAGLWIGEPSQQTLSLYKTLKVNPAVGATYTSGARYTFLIGRKNSNGVDFGGQTEVYSAVASSLGALITDDKAQTDFFNYYLTNIDSTGADAQILPDETKLFDRSASANGNKRPPFLSAGFARLSLGRDRFREYASERLARDVVERLLENHLRYLPAADSRTEAEKLDSAVADAWTQFLEESKLNERNPANDIIDSLRPSDRKARAANFKNEALAKASAGISKEGFDAAQWQTRLLAFWETERTRFLSQEQAARYEVARSWVASISESFPLHVGKSVARWGLPVTVRLLEKFDGEIEFFIGELTSEADEKSRTLSSIQGSIHQALTKSGQAKMLVAHPDIQEAANKLAVAIDQFASEIDLRRAAVDIIKDFRANLLKQLREASAAGWESLRTRVNAKQLADGRVNEFLNWPDPLHPNLPKRFTPPPNERLLISEEEYPAEFQRLISETLPTNLRQSAQNDAASVAMMAILGDDVITPGEPAVGYQLFKLTSAWVPKDHLLQSANISGASSSARFTFSDDPEEYLLRARKWLNRDGSAFGNYLNIALSDYLGDGKADQAALTSRRQKFADELSSVLKASTPLIQINANILAAAHPGVSASANRMIFSTIPFELESDMGKLIKDVLTNSGIKDSKLKNALNALGQSRAQNIDVFTFQDSPLQPIVYDSIMRPIANGWLSVANDEAKRTGYWKWRRAKPLRESIPADPTKISAMVRGWFISTALDYYRADKNNSDGPKIEIWTPNRSWTAFPYPLLYPGKAPEKEYLGVVLESLSIALAQCNLQINDPLSPLAPYHRLMELGEMSEQITGELEDWIKEGKQKEGAPLPRLERAGSPLGTPVERRDTLVQFFDDQMSRYIKLFDEYVKIGNPYSGQRNWEISGYIISALVLLKEAVGKLDIEEFN